MPYRNTLLLTQLLLFQMIRKCVAVYIWTIIWGLLMFSSVQIVCGIVIWGGLTLTFVVLSNYPESELQSNITRCRTHDFILMPFLSQPLACVWRHALWKFWRHFVPSSGSRWQFKSSGCTYFDYSALPSQVVRHFAIAVLNHCFLSLDSQKVCGAILNITHTSHF